MKRVAVLALILALTATGCSVADVNAPEVTAVESEEQKPARPQDDFYRFVNEDTLKNCEFKYGSTTAGEAFDADIVKDRLKGIIGEVINGDGYEKGSEEYIIKNAYDLCVKYDYNNSPVPQDLTSLIKDIKNASTIKELMDIDAYMYNEYGVSSILNVCVNNNYLEPGYLDITFEQYQNISVAVFEDLMTTYAGMNTLCQMGSAAMQYAGYDKDEADKYGKDWGYIVIDIYNATDMEAALNQRLETMAFEMSIGELQDIMSNIDVKEYLAALGFDMNNCTRACAFDRGQLESLNNMLCEENLEALKVWELINLIDSYSIFITPHSELLIKYYGIDDSDPEDRAMRSVIAYLEDQTDPLYVEKYYNDEMDDGIRKICDDIKDGYRELIKGADWLTEETRAGLLVKLENIVYCTAKDLKRHDNAEYSAITGKDFFEFYHNYVKFNTKKNIATAGVKTDRTSPQMPMQLFNACYNPSVNNITITAAIMNAPFYELDADYYTNLGGIGFIVAHEMGHAFDSNCIKFNSDGKYDPSWLAQTDIDALEKRNENAVSYFEDNFSVFGVYHVNGELTLGENYADLGAMECIVTLADTDEQLDKMFTNFAKTWCEKKLDTAVFEQLKYDVHSPAVIRVNAILCTVDAFYDLYDVKEGDGMYIEPEKRISRWY